MVMCLIKSSIFLFTVFNVYGFYFPKDINWAYYYRKWLIHLRQKPVSLAILVDKDLTSVLIAKSVINSLWRFPGGKVEENEDFTDCIIREIQEELGIDISDRVLEDLSFTLEDSLRLIRVFIVEGVGMNEEDYQVQSNEIKVILV